MIETVEDAKRALAIRGFRAMFFDEHGDLPPMAVFTFAWDLPFMEAVVVRGEEDATSYRSKFDGHIDPFAPRNIVWHHPGTFVEAVAELFTLPAPGVRGAPSLVIPTSSELLVPRQKRRTSLGVLKSSFGA